MIFITDQLRPGLLLTLLATVACTPVVPYRDAGSSGGLDGSASDGGSEADAGGSHADAGGTVLDAGSDGTPVEIWLAGRSRLGARSIVGRSWQGGIATVGPWVYWVESGAEPGLYRIPAEGCDAGCVEKLAPLTRPSVFAATPQSVLVADVTVIRHFPLSGPAQVVATGSSELTALVSDGVSAFWATQSPPILKTPFRGITSTLVRSNGTPAALALAADRVFWVGTDVSGLVAVLQSMRTDGTNVRENSRSGAGFETMRGNDKYLYYAKDSPAVVVRLTMSNGYVEVVGTNAQGVADFALDDSYAYWVEPGSSGQVNGRLRRVAHESTNPELLAESIPWPVGLAVDRGTIFVLSAGTLAASWSDGRILKIRAR